MEERKQQQGGACSLEARQGLMEYANLIKQLLQSLTSKSATIPTPQQIMTEIIEKDKQLIKLVKEVEEHQLRQSKIQNLHQQLEEKDRAIFKLACILKEVETTLQKIITTAKDNLKYFEEGKSISVNSLVSYAHLIGSTTTAPAGWRDPSPPFPYYPPHPTQDFFRAALTKQMLPEQELMAPEPSQQPKHEITAAAAGEKLQGEGVIASDLGLDLQIEDSSESESEEDYDDMDEDV